MENPIKMDDLGEKPTIFGNTHMYIYTVLSNVTSFHRSKSLTMMVPHQRFGSITAGEAQNLWGMLQAWRWWKKSKHRKTYGEKNVELELCIMKNCVGYMINKYVLYI